MKVKSEREVAQSCLILWDPMDCSPPGSSIHGIFQARVHLHLYYSQESIDLCCKTDTSLHNPMYNPISIFTFLEMWYTTAAISKMLSNLISSQKTISFTGCLFQMHFFHPFGNTKGALLTVMAIDRYVAISTHSTT